MQAIHRVMPATQKSMNQPDPGRRPRASILAMLRHKEILMVICSGALMLAAWGIGNWSEPFSVLLYIASYVLGGYLKAKEGLLTLYKDRDLDVNLLMIAAALGAASIGYWNGRCNVNIHLCT